MREYYVAPFFFLSFLRGIVCYQKVEISWDWGTCHLTAMFKHTRGGVGGYSYRLRIIIELYSFIRKISFQSYVLTIELTNKYVLGGSSGIGRGAVLLLSKLGCSVAFGGRNKTELDNVAAKCKEARSDAQVINLFPPKRCPVIK